MTWLTTKLIASSRTRAPTSEALELWKEYFDSPINTLPVRSLWSKCQKHVIELLLKSARSTLHFTLDGIGMMGFNTWVFLDVYSDVVNLLFAYNIIHGESYVRAEQWKRGSIDVFPQLSVSTFTETLKDHRCRLLLLILNHIKKIK